MKSNFDNCYAIDSNGNEYGVDKFEIIEKRIYVKIYTKSKPRKYFSLVYNGDYWLERDKEEEEKYNMNYLYKTSEIDIVQLSLKNCF